MTCRAHKLDIIHRDLKPANVLIVEDGTLRLTDFGVALIGRRERVTETNAIIGTIDYLPPEVFQLLIESLPQKDEEIDNSDFNIQTLMQEIQTELRASPKISG